MDKIQNRLPLNSAFLTLTIAFLVNLLLPSLLLGKCPENSHLFHTEVYDAWIRDKETSLDIKYSRDACTSEAGSVFSFMWSEKQRFLLKILID